MVKKFTLTITDDGEMLHCDGENQGFTICELISLLELKKNDLIEQWRNEVDFTRTVKYPDGRVETISEKENENV